MRQFSQKIRLLIKLITERSKCHDTCIAASGTGERGGLCTFLGDNIRVKVTKRSDLEIDPVARRNRSDAFGRASIDEVTGE